MNERKAEKLYNGITGVGEDLIEEAGTVRKHKKITPWRGAAIAACLCLVLLGTAGAVAGVGGVHIKWLDGVAMREEDRSGYAVTDEGLTKFPLSCFPEEVLALGEEPNENGVNSGKKYFEFWEELEQFVGLEIYDNPVLDDGGFINSTGSLQLSTGGYGEDMASVLTLGTYRVENIDVSVHTLTYTEAFRSEKPYVAGGFDDEYEAYENLVSIIYTVSEDEELNQEETYVAQCGVPVIITRRTTTYGTQFYGHFILNGILISVDAKINPVGYTPDTLPDDPAYTLEVLKTILDGFQL